MTKNFTISEFECKGGDCKISADVKNNLIKLADQLQILRDKVNKPIKINSGYRCANYNDNIVKGSKNSRHKKGQAADIVIKGMTPNEVYELVCEMVELGQLRFGGIGQYNTFTHVDIRDYSAGWDYKKK